MDWFPTVFGILGHIAFELTNCLTGSVKTFVEVLSIFVAAQSGMRKADAGK